MQKNAKSLLYILVSLIASSLALVAEEAEATETKEATPPAYQDLNAIAAIVEDQIVTIDEVRNEMLPIIRQLQTHCKSQEEYTQRVEQAQHDILQNLVDRILIVKEFERQGFQIPQTIVDHEYDEYIQTNFGGDRNLLLEYLGSQGKDIRQFKKEFREKLIVSAMRGKQQRSQSEISPEKIEQYYRTHTDQFQQDEQVKLYQIILQATNEQTSKTIQKQAEAILKRLEDGEDFIQIANSVNTDNDIGWITHADMIPTLADAAFALEKGQHSGIIHHANTFFILYVADKKPAGIRPLDEVREEIEILVSSQLARENIERWLHWLRKQAYVKYYL